MLLGGKAGSDAMDARCSSAQARVLSDLLLDPLEAGISFERLKE